MGDIQKGFAFSGNSPNNVATAANLNNLVDQATIQTAFYTAKAEKTAPASADYLLLWDSVSQTFQKVQVQNLVPSGVNKSEVQGLAVTSSDGATATATANQLVMRAGTGAIRYVASFSGTANVTVYGSGPAANGRDFSPLTTNTWIYLWAISTGTTDALLLSSSDSSPSLPTGYTYTCLLSALIINSHTQLAQMAQQGNDVEMWFAEDGSAATVSGGADGLPSIGGTSFSVVQVNATGGVFSTVDLSRCVPPIATRVRGIIGAADTGGTNYAYAISPTSAQPASILGSPATMTATNVGLWLGVTLGTTSITTGTTAFGFSNAAYYDVATTPGAAQSVWVACNSNSSKHSMRVNGFRLSL